MAASVHQEEEVRNSGDQQGEEVPYFGDQLDGEVVELLSYIECSMEVVVGQEPLQKYDHQAEVGLVLLHKNS